VGSSYIIVSALKCVMTCEYGKEPSWGLRLWYQFGSIVISIIIVYELFLAASLAQWRACWVSFLYVDEHTHSMSIYVGILFLLTRKLCLGKMRRRFVSTW
jgi:hypothetical protein